MNPSLIISELAIVIASKNHNPRILTSDFLKCSGIVGSEWELARAPICTDQASQVMFSNGISIVAQPTRLMFMEVMAGKSAVEVVVPSLASKYIQILPHGNYQAIGLNFVGYVAFAEQPEAARQYISETLLSPGAWQEIGQAPMRATINLAYQLERGPFTLSVSEAVMPKPDNTTTPILLFSGNFSYALAGEQGAEIQSSCQTVLENWATDLETFKNLVNHKFLSQLVHNQLVVPNLFAMSPTLSA